MYSYDDIVNIKTNLEWIVHQATAGQHLPTKPDQKALYSLLELIQTYEALLDLINEFGTSVIDADVVEGLSVTESLIAKVKRSSDAM
ncbi:hypothetical protein [Enterobacter soli]|uniref:hypothetical protein n=1 Tax=Enterobacter soli TaxID=885040 RepID=UPI0034CD9EFA